MYAKTVKYGEAVSVFKFCDLKQYNHRCIFVHTLWPKPLFLCKLHVLKACLTPHQVLDLSHPHLFLNHISTLTRMRNGLPCVVVWEWEEGTSITGVHYPPSINYLRSCWHCEPVEVSKPTYTCVSNDWHQKWSSSGYGLYFKTHAHADVRSRNNLPQKSALPLFIRFPLGHWKRNQIIDVPKTVIHSEMEMLRD